jgi:hypothetical protein
MGLKNARRLSAAKGDVVRLLKNLPDLISNVLTQELNDLARELDNVAINTVSKEVADMGTTDIIRNAASIVYYAKKFGIRC